MAYMTDTFRIDQLELQVARLERVILQLAHVLKHHHHETTGWTNFPRDVDKAVAPLQEQTE